MWGVRDAALKVRVPVDQLVVGNLYRLVARNAVVGAYFLDKRGGDVKPAFYISREKFRNRFLDSELDWSVGPPHGTAIPVEDLGPVPSYGILNRMDLRAYLDKRTDEIQPGWLRRVLFVDPVRDPEEVFEDDSEHYEFTVARSLEEALDVLASNAPFHQWILSPGLGGSVPIGQGVNLRRESCVEFLQRALQGHPEKYPYRQVRVDPTEGSQAGLALLCIFRHERSLEKEYEDDLSDMWE